MKEEEINTGDATNKPADERSSLQTDIDLSDLAGMNPDEIHFAALQMTDPVFLLTSRQDLLPADYPETLKQLSIKHATESLKSHETRQPELASVSTQSESHNNLGSGEPDKLLEEESELEFITLKPKEKKKKKKKKSSQNLKTSNAEDEPVSQFVTWLNNLDKPSPKSELMKSRKKQIAKRNEEKLKKSKKSKRSKKSKKLKKSKQIKASNLVTEQKDLRKVEAEEQASPVKSAFKIEPRKQKEKGIQLSADVISETLAEVLANQGHTYAAIEMYEKLSLIYPEKKPLFAVKIKKLKKA